MDADAWLASLPTELARQRDDLRRMLDACRDDPRVRVLVVGCSIGRGVADRHSDIDAFVAIDPARWQEYVDELGGTRAPFGIRARDASTKLAGSGDEARAVSWIRLEDGVEVELVTGRATEEIRPRRDWVVLYDVDARVRNMREPHRATAVDVREFAYEGWSTLMTCAKYLERGSLWEAYEMVHAARTRIWRVWAAARADDDPQYGLTAVYDGDRPVPPPGLESTVARLDQRDITRAAFACAEILAAIWPAATRTASGSEQPLPPVAEILQQRIETLIKRDGLPT